MLWKFCAYGFLKNLRFFEPFLYLFFLEKGLSYTEIGVLIGVREVCINLFEVPTGILADVIGRRLSMVGSFSSYILSFLGFSLFGSFWVFLPAMILYAAGDSFRSGTHKAMIMEYLDIEGRQDEKTAYYGTTRGASRLGSAVAALGGGAIVYLYGNYNIVFLVMLVPYVLALGLMLSYPKALDGEPEGASWKNFWTHTKESFQQAFSVPDLRRVLLNASTYDAFFRVSKDYLAPVIEAVAVSLPLLLAVEDPQSRAAILVGGIYFFVYLNSFVSSKSSHLVEENAGSLSRALNLMFFLFSGAVLVAGLAYRLDVKWLTILTFFLFYSLYNLRKPAVVGYIGDVTEPQKRATILSTHTQLRSIAGAVLAPLLGGLVDLYGIGNAFLAAGIGLVLIGMLLPIREGSGIRGRETMG
jgi:MFS family permease